MATNIRSGNSTKQNTYNDKPADKEILKLTGEEYWHLSFLQKCVELSSLEIEMSQKDAEMSGLKRRIHELEKYILLNKVSVLKQKGQSAEKELVQFRTNIASRLKLQSLDNYIVDTETYALINDKEI
jgi:hypothetical protein